MRYCWHSVFLILSTVPFASFATPPSPLWSDTRVKHTWNIVPDNWESLGPPPAGTAIDLYIALKPHRESALIDALYEVSNPRHQKHEEVAELVAPHQDTLELVHSWLEYHGVPSSSVSRSHGGSWLTATGVPVSQADQLLSASYRLYKHSGTNETTLRTVCYALPEALHPLVETVAPTTYFDSPRTLMQAPRKPSSAESGVIVNTTSGERVRALTNPIITPAVLRTLYKTTAYVPAAGDYNALAILGFLNDNPSPADLTKFMSNYRKDALAASFQVVPVHGGVYDPTRPGYETSLDIQYASAMSYPTPQIFYCTGGPISFLANGEPGPEDAYLAWLKYLLALVHIPPTISISYANPETLVPWTYATTICNLFAQLGLRGVSVLIASGDNGVGHGNCQDGDGNVRFYTMFPASCPWVTSVGGTMNDPETAIPFSGGGFSEYFERPKYQNGMVQPFLENLGNQYNGFYNALGRGVPDISAQSHQFEFILANKPFIMSGTSCATPTFAGIITLLNDYLISTGRYPLGFLNLWLYDRGIAGLNDITSGNNPGCNTPGFTAITGWDPVTGLGTPNFERLQLVVDYLIHPVPSPVPSSN
ncbi:subtilisin-like protein [Lactarius quietus]|nr:subtilisin-like protein [Lactarius quietus]